MGYFVVEVSVEHECPKNLRGNKIHVRRNRYPGTRDVQSVSDGFTFRMRAVKHHSKCTWTTALSWNTLYLSIQKKQIIYVGIHEFSCPPIVQYINFSRNGPIRHSTHNCCVVDDDSEPADELDQSGVLFVHKSIIDTFLDVFSVWMIPLFNKQKSNIA